MTTTQTTILEPEAAVASNSNGWAALSHLSAFGLFLGVPSLVGPFLVWLFKRDDPYVDEQAKEALNFNISFLLYGIASALLIILLVGILLLPVVFVTWFVLVIVAAVKASAGEHYRYPLTIRFVN